MHWAGLIALLNVVGGGLKDTLYVTVGFLRAARFKPNDTFRWANKALLFQAEQLVVIIVVSDKDRSKKPQKTAVSVASLSNGPESRS